MARPALEVADIFRDHGPAWRKANAGHVSLGQLKVMSAIESCRTVALGGHVMRCEDCAHTQIAYNSCRNRHCPKCQGAAALAWMAERKAELLPVPYFHVVFTLPAAIGDIAYQNKAVDLRSLVQGFRRDDAHDRGRSQAPGRQDRLHLGTAHLGLRDDPSSARPHDRAGRWDIARRHALDRCRPDFFLPVRVLSRLFRRLMLEMLLAAHAAGRLQFFGDHAHLADSAAFKAYLAPLREPSGSSTASGRSPGPSRCWPICPATPTASRSPTAASSPADATGVTFSYKDYRIEGPAATRP